MKNQKYLESKNLSIILFAFVFLLYAVVYMTKNVFSSVMATIVEEGVMTKYLEDKRASLILVIVCFINSTIYTVRVVK